MAIIKLQEQDFSQSKIKMIISGYAGIGKTTLALSSPKPLLIDLDDGLKRVESKFRKDCLQASTYEELCKDLTAENLKDYETLVIDTGGRLFELIKPYVIKNNAQNVQKDGNLTLKGYGAVANEYNNFINMINKLDKHLIFIFHTTEEKDGDNTRLRIMLDGKTKNTIWQPMDLGGFVEIVGKKRTIGFSNCERYYAKGSWGINGIIEIPDLNNDVPNDFLTKLFETAKQNQLKENSAYLEEKELYDIAMKLADVIKACTNADDINQAMERLKYTKHALTSEKELKNIFKTKVSELNLSYNQASKLYE